MSSLFMSTPLTQYNGIFLDANERELQEKAPYGWYLCLANRCYLKNLNICLHKYSFIKRFYCFVKISYCPRAPYSKMWNILGENVFTPIFVS